MTLKEAIKLLADYQQWRLGNDNIPMQIPSEITEALDKVLNHIGATNELVELPQQNDVREDDIEKLAKEWFELKGHNIYNHYNEMPAFIAGYNKAKENTYTEEQVREAMDMARKGTITENYGDLEVEYLFDKNEIIQSLKQPKQ